MLVYFKDTELQCPLTKKVQLACGFGEKLDKLRQAFGHVMIVNSCCRSFEYNKKIGGHERSFHVSDKPFRATGGASAVDISTRFMDKFLREKLIFIACMNGWSIGLGEGFLHLDRRVDYTALNQTVFNYK